MLAVTLILARREVKSVFGSGGAAFVLLLSPFVVYLLEQRQSLGPLFRSTSGSEVEGIFCLFVVVLRFCLLLTLMISYCV